MATSFPHSNIAAMPAPGVDWPDMTSITVADLVGPSAANRQPNELVTRTDTAKDRIDDLIDNVNYITEGGAGSTVLFLPREGDLPMLGNLDLDSNKIENLATPSADADASTKKYVDDMAYGNNTLATTGTITPDWSNGPIWICGPLTGNITAFNPPTNMPVGATAILMLTQSAGGGNTIVFNSQYKFNLIYTLTATANYTDVLTILKESATRYLVAVVQGFAP